MDINEIRKLYSRPEIIEELELEVRAGSVPGVAPELPVQ